MTATAALPASDDFLGHPKGVYVAFFTEMWERFSFYGMKALLLLYLTKHHLFGDDAGYDLLGAYGGLVYCIPVIGGLLADRWLGMRKAVIFGGLLLVAGHVGMAFEGHTATVSAGQVLRDEGSLRITYLSLALIIMGVGFLKPNISTIVGRLYADDDPRRDSGFSLFYAGINLGSLFASLVCGYLGEAYGWRYGFGAAGIGMLAGLAMFLWGQKYLHGHAEPANPASLRECVAGLPREWLIYLLAVVGVLPIAWLMWATANGAFALGGEVTLAQLLMLVVLGGVLLWFAWFLATQCTPEQRRQMLALMALIFMALVFFTLYEQTYGSWVTFNDRLLTKDIVPALVIRDGTPLPWSIVSLLLAPIAFVAAASLSDRHPQSKAPRTVFAIAAAIIVVLLVRDCLVLPQTAGSLTYLGALFLVLLAPIFAALWAWLDRRGLDPSKPVKSAWGLLLAGASFIPLALAAQHVGSTGQMASVWWIVAAYFVLELGEMCLSPVGLSAVTQLAVPRVVSLMMGTWFLATAFSEMLAAMFGKLASIDVPQGQTMDLVEASARYAHLFWLMMWIGLGCGVIALVAAPLLKWMMRPHR
ncbi:oligopeptide:H+ symporter [uncultured Pseudoxanthomonas sp.]|uniref:peptide MFS transporter n=1 Tax=uncultured Pseudoxanthomonas sp. TaxID=281701 RepID=UPI002595F52D|nr:oligopeptide:H+ symporter [uncultured Pseudoxanthomonas sp.]